VSRERKRRKANSWRYVVSRQVEGDEEIFEIREGYFDAWGELLGYSEDPVPALGNDLTELQRALIAMASSTTSNEVLDLTVDPAVMVRI
jgi:hypothetical protein